MSYGISISGHISKLLVAVTLASAFVPPYGTELLAELADGPEPEVFDRTKRQVTDQPICDTSVIIDD